MLITHTVNHEGKRRIYLGGRSCLDAWLEPREEGEGWRFRYDDSAANPTITADDILLWATSLMRQLAHSLDVPFEAIDAVPFDTIAKLHTLPTTLARRIPAPQRDMIETGYMPTRPGQQRSKGDFSVTDFKAYHTKGRTRVKR